MTTAEFVPVAARRTRRLWLRSLSSKLVAGVVALVFVLVALVGSATYVSLKSFLFGRLDQQLDSVSTGNSKVVTLPCFVSPDGCEPSGPGNFRAAGHEWIAGLDESGTSILKLRNSEPADPVQLLQLSAAQRRDIVADPTTYRTVTTTDGEQLRIVAARARTAAGDPVIVVSGLSADDVQKTLGRLFLIELIIGTSAVVLAFGATTFGVQRSLRNLYKVTGTAREVTAELSASGTGLDRRVPVVEEGSEVGQLAESVNTLLSAVETQFAARVESEERMRQFMADASHELRTPLTSIRGYAELARMQRAAGNDAEDNLDRIESEGTRMSRLVEDLLMLARGDEAANSGAHDHEPVELLDLLDDVVSASRAAFPDRQIDLQPVPVPLVLGDRDQLLRVVRNLVTNACVHTRPDAPIVLRCYPTGDGAEIQISDQGPGLAPEDAAHVFERFWRADKARTRARGGSGLGMSIVATIIRAHSGSVRFDSTVEAGSTVTVWLPATAPAAPGTTP